jgi:hypothetical protein
MSAPKSYNVVWNPGFLVMNPTNLSAAYPYGGTELGVLKACVFRPGAQTRLHPAEEWGGVVVEATNYGYQPVFAAVLRSWDKDMLAKAFPNTAEGAVSQERVIRHTPNSGNRPGYRLSNVGFKLLWAPEDTVQGRGLILYNALPAVEEAAEMAHSMEDEFGIGVVFYGSPDATGRVFEQGKLSDLTL